MSVIGTIEPIKQINIKAIVGIYRENFPSFSEKVRIWTLDKTRPKYRGERRMIEQINEPLTLDEARRLFDDHLKSSQIYKVCLPEGELKDYLLETLPARHGKFIIVRENQFQDLDDLITYLENLDKTINLMILDVNDILYLEYIKDFNQEKIQKFNNCLEALVKSGIVCIILSDCYAQFYNGIHEKVEINIFP